MSTAKASPGSPEPDEPQESEGPQESGKPAGRRRGRPAGTKAGTAETRDRILAAAREEFSARGYDKTSVRSIGKAAGVDSALVHHYFGTKEQIFGAAIELSFAPAMNIPDLVVAGGVDGMGERVARLMLRIWENPVSREPLLAIVRSAVTNETAAAVFRGLVSRRVLARLAGGLDVPDAEFRVQLAAAQLVGIIMLRYIVRVEPMASADPEDIVAMVGPVLQRYLTAADVHP
ncbi:MULTISPECIES: TetR family transcriptional regulator [unclassified Streptomyces]|uniref:TetR/AcrR family transcriptional regulator n=1 Tax=unclassified Streptomyces TaxID=2593676 RepID=UPI00380C1C24